MLALKCVYENYAVDWQRQRPGHCSACYTPSSFLLPDLQEIDPLPLIHLAILVCDICGAQLLLHLPNEPPIRLPPLLKAEVADGVGSNQVLQCLQEQWERRLEVDAIGSQHNVR